MVKSIAKQIEKLNSELTTDAKPKMQAQPSVGALRTNTDNIRVQKKAKPVTDPAINAAVIKQQVCL